MLGDCRINCSSTSTASRRAWRIGQKLRCKVRYLYWKDTMEERAIGLMGKKMAAAQAIDGRFSAEGLSAMAEDEAIEMQLAKSLADGMAEDASREWAKVGEIQREQQEEDDDDDPVILSFEEQAKIDDDNDFYDDLAQFLDELEL